MPLGGYARDAERYYKFLIEFTHWQLFPDAE